ncbi:hypothetical protein V6N13_140609 [Hibiscus sabdariffa]
MLDCLEARCDENPNFLKKVWKRLSKEGELESLWTDYETLRKQKKQQSDREEENKLNSSKEQGLNLQTTIEARKTSDDMLQWWVKEQKNLEVKNLETKNPTCKTNSNVQYYGLYVHLANETKLLVDTSRRKTIRINFEVTFPVVACSILNLDAVDINEKQHLDVKHDIVKKRVDAHDNVIEMRLDRIGILKIEKLLQRHGGKLKHNETWCGSCYGSKEVDDQCYNSCEDICDAYRNKSWSFSNSVMNNQCTRDSFLQKIMGEASEGCDIYGSLEVIKVAENFHFALGKSFKESKVFFFYDLPPIKVTFKEHDISFLQFLTNVCAIVGADRVIRGGANMIFWGDIGNIYLSQLSGTHSYFAIKAMNKASLASDKKLSRAQIEKEILQLLDHPLLPTLYAHSETDRFSCLVIKYSPRGDLHTSRQQQPGKYFFEYARTFKLDDELVEKFGDIHGREFGIEMDSLDAMIIRVNNFEANYAFNRIKKENRE